MSHDSIDRVALVFAKHTARKRMASRGVARRIALAFALCMLVYPVTVAARALYAVDGSGGAPSTLYLLDPSNGRVIREIGPVGFNEVTGLAFNPVTGILYGVSSPENGTGELIRIDPETGAGTAIGSLGLSVGTPDLAFAPSGLLYVWTESTDDLARVDLATGAATVVGDCGVPTARTGLAIDASGNAVMKEFNGNLYSVDRVTGACTLLVALTPGTDLDSALAFDDKGTLYTIDRNGGGTDLYTADTRTGQLTRVGRNALANLSALAFQPPPLEPLYAVDGAVGNPATLYRLDPRNGAVLQTIGAVGFSHVVGLAFHPVTGALYATRNAGGNTGQLLAIDPETGAGTVVGGFTGTIPDISFAPSGVLYGWDQSPDDLVTIDLTSGTLTTVGDCGTGTFNTGLSVDATGQAWMKSSLNLYRVDRVTGACSFATTLAGPVSLSNVLATNGRGTQYTAQRQGGPTEIFTIDRATGSVLSVGSNGISNLAALAFRPHPLPPLYATDGAGGGGGGTGGPSTLYRLDPRNGSVLQTIGPVGFNEVVGIAFHPVTGVLYGVSSPSAGTGELLRIDVETGAGTVVGSLSLPPPSGDNGTPDVAFAPSGQLYTWSENGDDLALVDVATGAATIVGDCVDSTSRTGLTIDATGAAFVKAGTTLMSVDRVTGACSGSLPLNAPGTLHNALEDAPGGIFYSLERSGGNTQLFTVDPQTGAVNSVGTNAIPTLAGLAFKPPRATSLYAVDGADQTPSHLYLLDPKDASVVANLGPIGVSHVAGLDFHPVTRTLYAVSSASGGGANLLLRIDPETGNGTPIGAHTTQIPDIDFAPSGLLYGWTEPDDDDLITIDLATGAETLVGDCGEGTSRTGLAVDKQGRAFMKNGGFLFAVDRVSGACSFLTPVLGSTNNVLAFDDRDRLYTAARVAGSAELFRLDIGTGSLTSIGKNDIANLSALAFRPPPHPPFYAADGASGNASTLYRLDPRDGSIIQTIGAIGFNHVTAISFQPGTDRLYGSSSITSGGTGELLTIDRQTGAGTAIGSHGQSTPDLAFSPQGVLYGWVEGPDSLHRFDLGTGAATLVGNCGFGTSATGLAIDQAFNAYMKAGQDLYSVDLSTGVCTSAGTLTQALHNSLEFNDQGTLYSLLRSGGNGEIYTVDPQTRDVVLVGSNPISQLAAVDFIPEPSGSALLAAGIGALAGLDRWRRRRSRV